MVVSELTRRKKKQQPSEQPQNKVNKKKKRFLYRFSAITMLMIFVYVIGTFFQVYYSARNDQVTSSTKADAIVVLGAAQYNGTPSKVLVSRLEHALDLYEQKVAPVIIVTGGNQPGDITTEASASADWLLEKGVSDKNILREVQGHSTYDSIRDLSVFALDRNIKRVVIVTDGFHQKRSIMIAEDFGLEPIGSPVSNSPITGSTEWRNFVTETGRVSLGRIIGFRRVSKDSSLAGLVR